MDKITLPINLLNAIMGYLGKQPYDQVFQLIAEVQKEAQAQQQETPNGN
jgi:sensor histidine kinase regulating citrate/malate metabolism